MNTEKKIASSKGVTWKDCTWTLKKTIASDDNSWNGLLEWGFPFKVGLGLLLHDKPINIASSPNGKKSRMASGRVLSVVGGYVSIFQISSVLSVLLGSRNLSTDRKTMLL